MGKSRNRTGHVEPGKSWNSRISFSRPEKLLNCHLGYEKWWKIKSTVRNIGQVTFVSEKKTEMRLDF